MNLSPPAQWAQLFSTWLMIGLLLVTMALFVLILIERQKRGRRDRETAKWRGIDERYRGAGPKG